MKKRDLPHDAGLRARLAESALNHQEDEGQGHATGVGGQGHEAVGGRAQVAGQEGGRIGGVVAVTAVVTDVTEKRK